ncbi:MULTISPECIES: succinate dehydrogenase, hydrophobic membrane anchor protein [Sphingomonas]|jgi:succinate dehydrogenase / fumarate reductase, membrane anchor subunit|uniref:Succinate dehydrogenase hydrophobic membrane anchor subunit n=1 Tax=Sphingomonas zeae TaxID=1646122 RepID=A0A7Y6B7I9_9SPHN|nr:MULTISPECIES: succinate dehydrogenase, hydrophobic membrane anchor protein [Sphingomonas]MBB4046742.1 succinate dehydrogenase / fumarate reductase membrane anchor subunit [Sphingomonas zeae]MDK8184518.1 succinate dehydrogenase, hydrophobic membrane anchor protein [Sphingomonas zeae]MDK8214393.1 succinate dehydrogenase, hydrophobic membrane anchor protein [Sphingomonas sp. UMB7805-LC452B]NUU48850.1 succinate dehydrogenase, hydrophobic membrane anchor protein [Sphingomonas zeae]
MRSGTAIGRVRGLGSAKSGTHHWLNQRLTAGSNFLLVVWLLISILRQPSFDYASMHLWLSNPWAAIPMVLLVASIFYHMRLGLQVVIEDYEQDQNRVALLVVMNLFVFTIAAVAIFSILKIAFGAAA